MLQKFRLGVLFITVVTLLMNSFAFAQDEEVTLKIMHWSTEQEAFYQQVAEEFNKEYPNIKLEVEILAQSDYREALPLLFQQNEAPDIFFWISQSNRVLTAAELRDFGWVSPLAGADSDWQARFPENSFIEGVNTFEGEVYGFPFNDNLIWGPGYMFYDRAAFEAAGLDPDSPPATWSELRAVCEQIVEAGTTPYCLAVPLKETHFQRTWYAIAGSIMTDSFFDYQTGTYAIDDPRMLEAFNYIQGLFNDELVVPGVEDANFMRQAMGNGLAAIYFDGAWMPSVFKSMGFENLDLGVAATPVPDNAPASKLSQSFSENKYFVSSQTEHPEEAWLFIEWMTRPDGFFATNYLNAGFGTLAYADNAALITDPVFKYMAEEIGPNLRVFYPEPVLACPDAAKSEAFRAANAIRPNWEFEEMVEALVNGSDFTSVAAEIAEAKDAAFQETIETEAANGLNVSLECFTFPTFDYTANYELSNYQD